MLEWQYVPKDVCRRWNYRVSTPRPWMGADRLPWCRHSCPFTTGRGIGTETRGMYTVWMIICASIYIYNCVFGSLISDVTCNYASADEGNGWSVVACLSRALVVLYRMLTIFACHALNYVWDDVSIFNHLPRMFLSTDFAFRITDLPNCPGPHIYMLY